MITEKEYFKLFWKSREHLATVGILAVAFAVANPLALIIGAGAYALGWVYLPTSKWFRDKIEAAAKAKGDAALDAERAKFVDQRDRILLELPEAESARYWALADACQEMLRKNPDEAAFGKLHELMWTFLSMLGMRWDLEKFLSGGSDGKLDADIAALEAEIAGLKASPGRERLVVSKEGLMETLHTHRDMRKQSKENAEVLASELTRLEHVIQLLQADAAANTRSNVLSAKLDAGVESLQESRRIIDKMSGIRDLLEAPSPEVMAQAGFGSVPAAEPPPLPRRARGREPQSNS